MQQLVMAIIGFYNGMLFCHYCAIPCLIGVSLYDWYVTRHIIWFMLFALRKPGYRGPKNLISKRSTGHATINIKNTKYFIKQHRCFSGLSPCKIKFGVNVYLTCLRYAWCRLDIFVHNSPHYHFPEQIILQIGWHSYKNARFIEVNISLLGCMHISLALFQSH